MTEQAEKFDSWAVVEIFGHTVLAGRVSEATLGGVCLLRVDVPELPARTSSWGSTEGAVPAYTRYFGNGAIFSMTPCSEEVARRTCLERRTQPPVILDVPKARALAAPTGRDPYYEDDDNDEPHR